MSSKQTLTLDNFPIETDICISAYGAVSRAMYDREHSGNRESGLYGTHAFYTPKEDEILPVLFGAIYSGTEYGEVIFSKAKIQENGKLEIKLFGENQERLLEIKTNIQARLNNILEVRKNG